MDARDLGVVDELGVDVHFAFASEWEEPGCTEAVEAADAAADTGVVVGRGGLPMQVDWGQSWLQFNVNSDADGRRCYFASFSIYCIMRTASFCFLFLECLLACLLACSLASDLLASCIPLRNISRHDVIPPIRYGYAMSLLFYTPL